jgi:hypothetical protein
MFAIAAMSMPYALHRSAAFVDSSQPQQVRVHRTVNMFVFQSLYSSHCIEIAPELNAPCGLKVATYRKVAHDFLQCIAHCGNAFTHRGGYQQLLTVRCQCIEPCAGTCGWEHLITGSTVPRDACAFAYVPTAFNNSFFKAWVQRKLIPPSDVR